MNKYQKWLEASYQRDVDRLEEKIGEAACEEVVRNFDKAGFYATWKDSNAGTMHPPSGQTCTTCGAGVDGPLCFLCGSVQKVRKLV